MITGVIILFLVWLLFGWLLRPRSRIGTQEFAFRGTTEPPAGAAPADEPGRDLIDLRASGTPFQYVWLVDKPGGVVRIPISGR
jgi:hypothetical protein